MRKLIIAMLLLLVACSSGEKGSVECVVIYDDNQLIERSLLIHYTDNAINSIDSSDKIYFDDVFTKEVFEKLETELADKLSDAKNLSYEIEELEDHILINAKLSNIENAYDNELSFFGISINDKDLPIGLAETIKLNEANGYTCTVQ